MVVKQRLLSIFTFNISFKNIVYSVQLVACQHLSWVVWRRGVALLVLGTRSYQVPAVRQVLQLVDSQEVLQKVGSRSQGAGHREGTDWVAVLRPLVVQIVGKVPDLQEDLGDTLQGLMGHLV